MRTKSAKRFLTGISADVYVRAPKFLSIMVHKKLKQVLVPKHFQSRTRMRVKLIPD